MKPKNTKYRDTFPDTVREYASDGLINREIAKKLGISEYTLYRWIKEKPEFAEAEEDDHRRHQLTCKTALFCPRGYRRGRKGG